ncbi:XrtB/PEP-CTERM-associated polysaccharide biosynthesis outer membrane protein EpsL [Massilia sp. BJB1822]|uniref:XrtB/PEP-CTERM-associated polysaccharide biosynthesis outer membrane protein EpsL n=1 Tax=Massilia sp. BJB1822 TaxID=2744470 RepID=UPI001E339390|nr:XrtB/PEP-CTERM-associated polysaccharide biosynthesis outer membrane protein EpsL [Massilia sp. BJB1822]
MTMYPTMSKRRGALRVLPLALLAALAQGAAHAALSDTIHPFVSFGYTHDGNLLRLPDQAPGFGGPRGDNIRQAQAGVSLERPIGRQKLTASAKVSRVTFDHYDQLDYNGKDFAADLAWQLGNHLDGRLGATYTQTLTPFTDFHSEERNLRTYRREYADGAWRFHPSWRLRAGVSRGKFDYDLRSQSINDRKEDLAEAGIDYLAASGSRVGLVARKLKGRYEHPRAAGDWRAVNWNQDELKANIYWLASGVTQVTLLAGWARREYENLPQRDSSGLNGRLRVDWKPLGKVRFNGQLWREFAAVESSFITNSLNRGSSLEAIWDVSAKVQLNGNVRRERRRFETLSGVILPVEPSDSLRNASVGLVYAPQPSVQLGISAFQEKRSGNPFVGTSSFSAKGMSVTASAQF